MKILEFIKNHKGIIVGVVIFILLVVIIKIKLKPSKKIHWIKQPKWGHKSGTTGMNTQCEYGYLDPDIIHYDTENECVTAICKQNNDCCYSGFTSYDGKCYAKPMKTSTNQYGHKIVMKNCGSEFVCNANGREQDCGPTWMGHCSGTLPFQHCNHYCRNDDGWGGMSQIAYGGKKKPTKIVIPHCQCNTNDHKTWFSVGNTGGGLWNQSDWSNYACEPGKNDENCTLLQPT